MFRMNCVVLFTVCSVALADTDIPDRVRDRDPLDQGADNCPATVIPGVPYTDTGTTVGRQHNFNFLCTGAGPDVIYQYTPSASGIHTVSLCGSTYDTALELRMGGTCPGNMTLGCNDDACDYQSELSGYMGAGTTYFIIVGAYGSQSGTYTLNVTRNDSCVVACQDGDLIECAESPIPGYDVNDCNGGCDNVDYGGQAHFQDIHCGQAVCGRLFRETADGEWIFNYDWYRFTVSQACSVRVDIQTVIDAYVRIRSVDCPPFLYSVTYAESCLPTTFSSYLNVGTYALTIDGQGSNRYITPLPYRVTLNCCGVERPPCPDSSLVAQLPTLPYEGVNNFFMSDTVSSDRCWESFSGVTQPIGHLRFWGTFSVFQQPVPCDDDPQFRITFYANSGGVPGAVLGDYLRTASVVPLYDIDSYTMYQFDTDLSPPCNAASGFISIAGVTPGDNCVFYWTRAAAGQGDGHHLGHYFTYYSQTSDLAYCLSQAPQCPPIDSLTIRPFEEGSFLLDFFVPTPGFVRFFFSSDPTAVFPAGFTQTDQFHANTAGRYNNYEIAAPGGYGRFVATLDSCGQ
jgi:hypothetical protein